MVIATRRPGINHRQGRCATPACGDAALNSEPLADDVRSLVPVVRKPVSFVGLTSRFVRKHEIVVDI